jgi:hypothetical protein
MNKSTSLSVIFLSLTMILISVTNILLSKSVQSNKDNIQTLSVFTKDLMDKVESNSADIKKNTDNIELNKRSIDLLKKPTGSAK